MHQARIDAAMREFRAALEETARAGDWEKVRAVAAELPGIRVLGPWRRRGGVEVRDHWLGGHDGAKVAPDQGDSRERCDQLLVETGAILVDAVPLDPRSAVAAGLAEGLDSAAIAEKTGMKVENVRKWIRKLRAESGS